ncbi:DNA replication licensing factor mcm8 [Actinomortierella ambigua]|uniref:Minichromosome maintenance 8 n=1 Tax=Actinomortierella ambigua TaxID=1343610 RepID=A0A9P6U0E6_9FUNG|nr:DNA replication licensing factor mcm8 [Actinomortierella ambigua]KAG0255022.1 DNA replication licensing factor mcm8 [Actinomortierella ambigua]
MAFSDYFDSVFPQTMKSVRIIKSRGALVVNVRSLLSHCAIEGLQNLLVDQPEAIMGCVALAALQVVEGQRAEDAKANSKKLTIRFSGFDRITHGKDLKANLIGKLVCVRGTVVRASGVKPFARGVGYETETVDWQSIRIQQKLPDDKLDAGRVPRTIECEVTKELVDKVVPGDVIEVTGIVKAIQSDDSKSRTKTGNTMFLLYIDVSYINKAAISQDERDYVDSDEGDDSDDDNHDRQGGGKESIQLTRKDLYAIEDIHTEPQLFKLIVNSFCPTIYGHELVKAGILFALFGGRRRQENATSSRTTIRSDPHVLIVGDPGLGKSQMLSAAVKVAPRGVYVCGSSGISTSGLTVTLVRGSGADFALEAGALALGDQGCCCIDEFDKMSTDHNALLEAMEQQTISIAKAGILCSLRARTSVIAAANPIGGHYDMGKTVSENLKMNGALLSRFDLIFILMDKPDCEMDQFLSKHVMALHAGQRGGARGSERAESVFSQRSNDWRGSSVEDCNDDDEQVKDEPGRPLSERLRMTNQDNLELIPLPLLRKYIAYTRKYVHPRLSSEAAAVLQDFYMALRTRHRSPDGTPVTTRQLESLIRLAEAKARMECREHVTRRDALDVIEVMTYSLYDAHGLDDIRGGIDPAQSTSPVSGSRGKSASIKRFVAELQRVAMANASSIFSYQQLYEIFQAMRSGPGGLPGIRDDFSSFVETLNNHNFLLKKGPRAYQLTTFM